MILIVPAHNPSEELISIVANLRSDFRNIVIVNDGSDPQYDWIFDLAARYATILTHGENRGMGAALKTGFGFALESNLNVAGIVAADADGQHCSEDIRRVANVLLWHTDRGIGRVILGAREFGPSVPFRSRFGNLLTCKVLKLFTGIQLRDTQTGLRGWPRSVAQKLLGIKADGFDYQLECLLKAEAEFLDIPIRTIYKDGNKCSHFKPVQDSIRIYGVFLKHAFSEILGSCRSFVGRCVRRIQRALA